MTYLAGCIGGMTSLKLFVTMFSVGRVSFIFNLAYTATLHYIRCSFMFSYLHFMSLIIILSKARQKCLPHGAFNALGYLMCVGLLVAEDS